MKKFFAILLALTVVPTFHSYAWVGGPFSNNSLTPEGDDGIYEAVGTTANGLGLYRWGVQNRNTPVDYNNGRQGNTSNVQFGGFAGATNEHVWYFQGTTYYGTCFGTVSSGLGGIVHCVGTAATADSSTSFTGTLGGPGLVVTGSAVNITFIDATGDGVIDTFVTTTAAGVTLSSSFSANIRNNTYRGWTPATREFHGNGELTVGLATPVVANFIVFGSRVSLQVNG